MQISIYWLAPVAVGFFAFGILFGRKNKNKADALAKAANKVADKTEAVVSEAASKLEAKVSGKKE